MRSFYNWLKGQIVSTIEVGERVARAKAVGTIETELAEMENIFSLLVLGSFVGIPSPPVQISLDLMPHMERELITMLEEVDTATTPISRLLSTFDVG